MDNSDGSVPDEPETVTETWWRLDKFGDGDLSEELSHKEDMAAWLEDWPEDKFVKCQVTYKGPRVK